MYISEKEKSFFETFPGIMLTPELSMYAERLNVTRITKDGNAALVRIYTISDVLIPKDVILKLEDILFNKIFRRLARGLRILDRYSLGESYTPENLFDSYKESITLELSRYFHSEYILFNKSDVFFKDDVLHIVMEKGFFSERVADDLKNYFYHLFLNRFFIDVPVLCEYKDNNCGRFDSLKEHELDVRIRDIIKGLEGEPSGDASDEEKEKTGETTGDDGSEDKPEKDTDEIYGKSAKSFDEDFTPIKEIDETSDKVIICGMIRKVDTRPIRNEKTLVKMDITDFEDTISATLFLKNEDLDTFIKRIEKGMFIKLSGKAEYNKFEQEVVISRIFAIKRSTDTRQFRHDNAFEKRVELNCHTKMSEMDGVTYAKDILAQAYRWGHKAIAITDTAVVHAFPECVIALQKLKEKNPDCDLQVIYGMDAYVVDDERSPVHNDKGQSLEGNFVVFDIETTGFSAVFDKIIEIGAVKIKDGIIVDRFSAFINPEVPIPYKIEKLTSISDSMVKDAETIDKVLPEFLDFISGCVLVAHNADFDTGFIRQKAEEQGITTDLTYIDTVSLAQFLVPGLSKFNLDALVKYFHVTLSHHHRAVDDAEATAEIFLKMLGRLKEREIFTLKDLKEYGKLNPETVKKLHAYTCTLLAATQEGKDNLYRLVSKSHIDHFYRVPKIPKSLLGEYREGLLVGSSTASGELFEKIVSGKNYEDLLKAASFYDYLEIQPVENNMFLIDDEDSYISSKEDLQEINKKIVSLGDALGKPVAATGDVRFLNPEDAIYRSIIQFDKDNKKSNKSTGNEKRISERYKQPPLYFRTTEEMLESFSYLGDEKAFETVVRNPNMIRLMCEDVKPLRPDKCPPVIENSDVTLKEICYKKAHDMYGEELPVRVSERLERELDSIISNGYSVMYIIAQKLVSKSNEDGYLVGSRGSVGSSLAATMAGISEVNPLSPHYLCPECHYSDFESEDVKAFAGGAGCDMPDKKCPKCGADMRKRGFDIPFETFLGFKGNKEPDIDLNFSNEYQSKAHAYTEIIFGKGQTFKAGTISTVAEKLANTMVWKYFKTISEEEGTQFKTRRSEIERIAAGCTDVKRTTGQHPGGIVVLPIGEEIHTFCPVQHPANDTKSGIITTHFDYHSIDHNLLKLDILGHLDPTMIRKLQDLTGLDPLEIPLDNKEVMSLFKDTSALGIKPEDIGGTPLGALGVPEFGTDFAMEMVREAKPTKFSDLVRISGLSHGTNVWVGNTQELLREGKATISTAICTRDDIMVYLIGMGLDKELSFNIMESVRKGKGLKAEWEDEMKKAGVPDWYIWSCNKIEYMFPKAHAVAYVMMAWRIAYFKIFYPLEYYCAYFSIREKAFDYEKMALGKDRLKYFMDDYRKREATKDLTDPEQNELKDMRIAEEMYARGFEFVPVDIYKAKAKEFQIIDGKIMPSFKVIDKVGEVAGENIERAAKKGPFLSKEDLMRRAKIGAVVIEKLEEIHAIDDLSESDQISFFDNK